MESGRPPGNRLPSRVSSVNLISLPTSAGMLGPLNSQSVSDRLTRFVRVKIAGGMENLNLIWTLLKDS